MELNKTNLTTSSSDTAASDKQNNVEKTKETIPNPSFTIKDTVTRILNESNHQNINPETLKAALDAVRYEHQRLQNEFMSLMSLNEHVQQEIDKLDDNVVKMEMDLQVRDN